MAASSRGLKDYSFFACAMTAALISIQAAGTDLRPDRREQTQTGYVTLPRQATLLLPLLKNNDRPS